MSAATAAAWHLHPTDSVTELVDGFLEPWSQRVDVTYRPSGWVARGRDGAVTASARRPLVVEEVGAARHEPAPRADLVIRVQSDDAQARRCGMARDVEAGRPAAEAEAFWDEWMTQRPFLDAERAWERADLVADGTHGGLGGGSVTRSGRGRRRPAAVVSGLGHRCPRTGSHRRGRRIGLSRAPGRSG
ncbi:MAG: hypothetical protein ACRCSN_13465 [Dermatophilaceae bacterium]